MWSQILQEEEKNALNIKYREKYVFSQKHLKQWEQALFQAQLLYKSVYKRIDWSCQKLYQ